MTKIEIESKIEKLEKGINSRATPPQFIPKLKAEKEKLEGELAKLNSKKPAISRPTSSKTSSSKVAKAKSILNKYKYLPNRNVDSVVAKNNGKKTTIDSKDILDGVYVKKEVKYAKGGNTNKQEWVAVFQKGNEQKVIQCFGNTKDEAIRDAMMSRNYNAIPNNYELVDIYTKMGKGGGTEIGGNYTIKNDFGSFTSVKVMAIDSNYKPSKSHFSVQVSVRKKEGDKEVIQQKPIKTYPIESYDDFLNDLMKRGAKKMAKGGGVSSKEYIVWGVPPNKKDEEILFTKAESSKEAQQVCKILTEKHGCKNCRVQVLDLSGNADFSKMFTSTIKKNNGGYMAKGGNVSKGELVWRKLTQSQRLDLLHKNFTPQITPRSQEILVGKPYNFLPKNIKIVIESKYSNDENYSDGRMMGNKYYYTMSNVGKSKYVVNFHDGVKTHKDGSAFYDIKLFKNKKDNDNFIKKLISEGYKYKMADGGEVGNWYKEGSDKWGLEKSDTFILENNGKYDVHLRTFNNKTNKWGYRVHSFDTLQEAKEDGYSDSIYADGGMLNLLADTSGASLQNVGGSSFSNVDLTPQMDITNPFFAKGGQTESFYDKLVEEHTKGGYEKFGVSFDSFLNSKMESAIAKGDMKTYHKLIDVKEMYGDDFYADGGEIKVGDMVKLETGAKAKVLRVEDSFLYVQTSNNRLIDVYKKDVKKIAYDGNVPTNFGKGKNINVFGYETKFFINCPKAVEEFENSIQHANTDEEKENLSKLAEHIDKIFEIEHEVVHQIASTSNSFDEAIKETITASYWNYRSGMAIDLFSFVPQHLKEIALRINNTKFEGGGGLDFLADTSGAGLQNVGGSSFSNVDLTPQMDITNPMFAKGGGTFNGIEFRDLLGEGVTNLWEGYNGVELAIRYMEVNGQGGMVSMFKNQYKIDELKSIIEKLDDASENKYANGGQTKEKYKIFEGHDSFKNKTIYSVHGVDNDYFGEWHTSKEDAEQELNELNKKHYAKGGGIPNNYRGRTTEDIWNSLTEDQRTHFMFDHFNELGVKESEIVRIANKEFQDLNEDVKGEFKVHTMMGQYAHGGLTEHGLKIGDKIIDKTSFSENGISVMNDGKYAMVDLDKGERIEGIYAKGGGVDNLRSFDFNEEGNLATTINGKYYEIIYRDDKSQMYDLFENGKKIKSSRAVRDVMTFADGGGLSDNEIGFIPMDLEEKFVLLSKWGGINVKELIGILNAMIDTGITDNDLIIKPLKNTSFQREKAIEKKIKEIWQEIEPQYKGDLKGYRYYSTLKELIGRNWIYQNLLKQFKPFRKFQKFEDGGTMANGGMVNYKKIKRKGEDEKYGFKYIVREEGENYVIVEDEKIELWEKASPIDRKMYYEDLLPKEEVDNEFEHFAHGGYMAKGGNIGTWTFNAVTYNDDEDMTVKEKKVFKVKASTRSSAYQKAYKKYPKPYFVELYSVDYADGGETDGEEDMGVQFIDYKDTMIMYEPHYKEYYTNDIQFDSLEKAKKYIDNGSKMTPAQINLYRKGAMANGGAINKYFLRWDSINSRGGVNHNTKELSELPNNIVVNQSNYVFIKKDTVNGKDYVPVRIIGGFKGVQLSEQEIKDKKIKRVETMEFADGGYMEKEKNWFVIKNDDGTFSAYNSEIKQSEKEYDMTFKTELEAKNYIKKNYPKSKMEKGGTTTNSKFPIVTIFMDANGQEGLEELYDYLEQEQGIIVDNSKNYKKDKGTAQELYTNDDYLLLEFNKSDLRNVKKFEKKFDDLYFPKYEITYRYEQKMGMGGKTDVFAKNTVDLIKQSNAVGSKKVRVEFYPAYDEKEHSKLSEKLKDSLKEAKVSIFDVDEEAFEIVNLVKNPKDVKSITWVKEKMVRSGKTTFNDKVKEIAKNLLKKKKVSPKVQKDYGKTYDKKEAVDSAKRIVGAMKKKAMAKNSKLKINEDDFSFLLDLSDRELSKRLDLVRKQQDINSKQYFSARDKKESTTKIEESRKRLDNQERAIIEARLKVNNKKKS